MTLHIELLGHCRITHGDTLVPTAHSQRLQALIAFLVLHRNTPQPRVRIANHFWPDSRQPQTNLRGQILKLRQILPDVDTYVESTEPLLQWRAEAPFTLDVAIFEQAVAEGDAAARRGDDRGASAAWMRALDAYRDELLPGCYADWLIEIRQSLEREYRHAGEALVTALERAGELDAAIHHAKRLLARDTESEAAYLRLALLQAANGDRTGALQTCRDCAAMLQREFGAEPGAQLKGLLEHQLNEVNRPVKTLILPGVQPAIQATQGGVPSRPQPVRRTRPLPVALTRCIGREVDEPRILAQLGERRLVTLTGLTGVGKSRLALAVAHAWGVGAAEPAGALVLSDVTASEAAWVGWVEPGREVVAGDLWPAIAVALGIAQSGADPSPSNVCGAIGDARVLLVVDNSDRALSGAAFAVSELLTRCPNAHVLATCREPLDLDGEVVWQVGPLETPPGSDLLPTDPKRASLIVALAPSVRLFMERAGQNNAGKSDQDAGTAASRRDEILAAGEICRRLDGMPLAIELAAHWTRLMSTQALLDRWEATLCGPIGPGYRPGRAEHRSLMEALDLSFAVLTEAEKSMLVQVAQAKGRLPIAQLASVGQNGSSKSATLKALDRLVRLGWVDCDAATGEVGLVLPHVTRMFVGARVGWG